MWPRGRPGYWVSVSDSCSRCFHPVQQDVFTIQSSLFIFLAACVADVDITSSGRGYRYNSVPMNPSSMWWLWMKARAQLYFCLNRVNNERSLPWSNTSTSTSSTWLGNCHTDRHLASENSRNTLLSIRQCFIKTALNSTHLTASVQLQVYMMSYPETIPRITDVGKQQTSPSDCVRKKLVSNQLCQHHMANKTAYLGDGVPHDNND